MLKPKKTETKRTIQRIIETKSWVFEKISKIDKPLSKLPERPRKYSNKQNQMRTEGYNNRLQGNTENH